MRSYDTPNDVEFFFGAVWLALLAGAVAFSGLDEASAGNLVFRGLAALILAAGAIFFFKCGVDFDRTSKMTGGQESVEPAALRVRSTIDIDRISRAA